MPAKKPSEASLKKLRAKACFTRDGYACVRCGRTDTLAPSHIYPQGRYPRMKWLLVNMLTLCYACHIHWWHKNPIAAAQWVKTILPKSRIDYLTRLTIDNNLPKPDLIQVKKVYLDTIEQYGSSRS